MDRFESLDFSVSPHGKKLLPEKDVVNTFTKIKVEKRSSIETNLFKEKPRHSSLISLKGMIKEKDKNITTNKINRLSFMNDSVKNLTLEQASPTDKSNKKIKKEIDFFT
jgi:hypothetical protein